MQKTTTTNARQAAQSQNNSQEAPYAIYLFETSYPGGHTADSLLADSRVERIIGGTARKMLLNGNFQTYEEDDIKQELRLAILHEMSNYDPNRDLYTFIGNVVTNYARNINDRRIRERLQSGVVVSLDEKSGDEKNATYGDTISTDDASASNLDGGSRMLLKITVDEMMQTLSPLNRTICKMLLDGASYREICKETHISLAVLHKHIHRGIKKAALAFGLDEFTGGAK